MNIEKWRVWDKKKEYGEILYKRAVGDLPEMESSKALAKEISEFIKNEETIVDVGCGSGHYLRTLRNEFGENFNYLGLDATSNYINLAKKAFVNDKKAEFRVADIYKLDLKDKYADITICCNLLLHLPSISKPIEELIRVTKKVVELRLLSGDRSFRIMDVFPQEDDIEFSYDGDPLEFYYYNIYSKKYIEKLILSIPRVKEVHITDDYDYSEENITNSINCYDNKYNVTKIIAGQQVNGYILQPWVFVKIILED